MELQRAAGNRAVVAALAQAQTKLEVGAADDQWEREADDVARRIVGGGTLGALTAAAGAAPSGSVRRQPVVGREGGSLDAATERALQAARGHGSALPEATKTAMGSALGADLSQVRLHAGAEAAALNEQLSAKAFTIGTDIFFRDGMPDAGSAAGKELLAHELTHTVQQSGGGEAGVHRLYVETEIDPTDYIKIDGASIGYKWIDGVDASDFEVSPVKTGWWRHTLYRPKAKAEGAKADGAKAELKPDASVKAAPVLDAKEKDRLEKLAATLEDWAKIANEVSKSDREERRRLATLVKKALAGGDGGTVDELGKGVAALRPTFAEAKQRVADKAKDKQDALAAEQTKKADLAMLAKVDADLLAACGGKNAMLLELRRAFSDDDLIELIKIAPAPTLQKLLPAFEGPAIKSLLQGESDLGAGLRALQPKVKKRTDPTALLAADNKITPAQLKLLLADTTSTTLIDLAPKVKSGAVLLKLRAQAASEDAFATNVTHLLDAGWQPALSDTAVKDKDTTKFDTDLKAQKKDIGLEGENGTVIAWMPANAISGDGDENEQAAVTAALKALDTGAAPVHKVCEMRAAHRNDAGRLPGAPNVVPYREWGIAPPSTDNWPGPRRLVVDNSAGDIKKCRIYYTWTHYGDHGSPAFVRIR